MSFTLCDGSAIHMSGVRNVRRILVKPENQGIMSQSLYNEPADENLLSQVANNSNSCFFFFNDKSDLICSPETAPSAGSHTIPAVAPECKPTGVGSGGLTADQLMLKIKQEEYAVHGDNHIPEAPKDQTACVYLRNRRHGG